MRLRLLPIEIEHRHAAWLAQQTLLFIPPLFQITGHDSPRLRQLYNANHEQSCRRSSTASASYFLTE